MPRTRQSYSDLALVESMGEELQEFYTFNDTEAIAHFLRANAMADTALHEGRDAVARFFGPGISAGIDLIQDPEGSPPMLLVTIRSASSVTELLEQLRRFRRTWWSRRDLRERQLIAWSVG